jgi:hypothetical protein
VQVRPDAAGAKYLYADSGDQYGMHFIGQNITVGAIREIYRIVNSHAARKIVFLTSMIVRPFLAQLLEEFAFLSSSDRIEFDLQVVPNRFLGGNIVMGDMLVLDDFRDFLDDYLRKEPMTDLVLLPSGPFNLGGWLRDMKGQSFEVLRRRYAVPVFLIKAAYFE